MPVGVKVFDGELTSQVQGYYDGLKLSPVIRYRTNIGVIVDNHTYQFYRLRDLGPQYAMESLHVEFPYMCYVYVDRVEVDTDVTTMALHDMTTAGGGERRLLVSVGDEYLMAPFTKDNAAETKDRSSLRIEGCHTLVGRPKESKAGYYVNVFLGFKMTYVAGVMVYGRAVCFA